MNMKKIKVDEIPKGEKNFVVLRIDKSMRLILEQYTFNEFERWENEVIAEFPINYAFDKNKKKLWERIKEVVPQEKVIYVEEGTFIDEN